MKDFKQYMTPGRRGHLIGIGGVSMSPLAEVLQGMGLNISGSDINESENVEHLREKGIKIILGHHSETITPDIDFIVRTAAVHDDNPEIASAHAQGNGCPPSASCPRRPGSTRCTAGNPT